MNVVLIGPSGAGKGTQAAKLKLAYGFSGISVGDMLRQGTAGDTTLGKMVKSYMDQGQLVRDEVVDALIKSHLRQPDYLDSGVIFDGFPRTEYQAKFLDELLNEMGHTLDVVIYMNVTDHEVKRRLPGRLVCTRCHTPYHQMFSPFTVCHVCGSTEVYQRDDDRPEVVDARLKDFHRLADPLLEYYHKSGLLTIVNGEGSIEEIYYRLVNILDAVENNDLRPATRREVARIQALRDESTAIPIEQATQSSDFVLLGGPGSGKGTQAAQLSQIVDLIHVSTGDLFRSHLKDQTELGRLAKTYIDRGELVPDDVTQGMVRERLERADVKSGFILDGFPRNISQAEALTEIMTDMRRRLSGVLYINVSDDEIVERLSGRITCQECQTSFHVNYNPPKKEGTCDKCSGNLKRREDDEPETIKARLRTYYGQTAPLISYYRAMGLLYEIDGEGEVQNITERILTSVRRILNKSEARKMQVR